MNRVALPLAIALLAILAAFCACHHRPRIESTLAERGLSSIEGMGSDLRIEMDGRTARIGGFVADASARSSVLARLADVPGIRRIDDGLTLAPSDGAIDTTAVVDSPGSEPSRFDLSLTARELTVGGTVGVEELHDSILAWASERFGAARVRDALDVVAGVSAPTLEEAKTLIDRLAAGPPDGGLRIVDGVLTVFGSFPDEAQRDAFVATIHEAFPGRRIVDETMIVAAPKAEDLEARVAAILRDGEIRFQSSSAELTPEGVRVLTDVVRELRTAPTLAITIEGHTDSRGDAAMNLGLSEQRAQSVFEFLVAGGIAPDRMTSTGFGESRPRADNETPDGRSANRRIEFRLREGRE